MPTLQIDGFSHRAHSRSAGSAVSRQAPARGRDKRAWIDAGKGNRKGGKKARSSPAYLCEEGSAGGKHLQGDMRGAVMGLSIVILGLSITSSWGNGHATTYRSLVRGLSERGHRILFLEKDLPWYASNRDAAALPYCSVTIYKGLDDLKQDFVWEVREADLVLLGSCVPDGIEAADWIFGVSKGIKAFYDIDTPVTLEKLKKKDCPYLRSDQIPRFDLYLSFTGGPLLDYLEHVYGARAALPLYCSVDQALYYPEKKGEKWDLGYLGAYSLDRQDSLDLLLMEPARRWPEGRFVVAGPQYPPQIAWPGNVERIDHLAPPEHRGFYNSQRFTLNVTRATMIRAGYSPGVRLFEAAACETPIITDPWDGLDSFFQPGEEILAARSAEEVMEILRDMPEERRREIGRRARQKVLSAHTAKHRAEELEQYVTGRWRGNVSREVQRHEISESHLLVTV